MLRCSFKSFRRFCLHNSLTLDSLVLCSWLRYLYGCFLFLNDRPIPFLYLSGCVCLIHCHVLSVTSMGITIWCLVSAASVFLWLLLYISVCLPGAFVSDLDDPQLLVSRAHRLLSPAWLRYRISFCLFANILHWTSSPLCMRVGSGVFNSLWPHGVATWLLSSMGFSRSPGMGCHFLL